MPVMTSLFQFGAYVFPNGFRMKTRDPEIKIGSIAIQHMDGAFFNRSYLGGKNVRIEGTIGGIGQVDSNGNPYVTWDDTVAELNRMDAAFVNGYDHLTAGYADGRYLVCQRKKMTVTPRPQTVRTIADVVIDLYAQDPRWLSPVLKHSQFSNSGAWLGPDGNASAGTNDVAIGGSAPAYPVAVFHGPLSLYTAEFQYGFATGQREFLWFNAGDVIMVRNNSGDPTFLASGEDLTIDSDPFNRANAFLLNGDPVAGYARMFGAIDSRNDYGDDRLLPFLWPSGVFAGAGENQANRCVVQATGTFDVYWREAWAA